ncbi:MAG: ArsR family transcriptional regulator [Candidatus Syntropharchaeia archaeon]
MAKRTRIVNDPTDFIPLLRAFSGEKHKKIFDILSTGWKTEKELEEMLGFDVKPSLKILERSGLLESRWRMPEPGKTPEKEYFSSYAKVMANFQCSLKDFGDLIMIAFMDEEVLEKTTEKIVGHIQEGRNSVNNLSRALDVSPTFLKGIVKRSPKLNIKGQRIEIT